MKLQTLYTPIVITAFTFSNAAVASCNYSDSPFSVPNIFCIETASPTNESSQSTQTAELPIPDFSSNFGGSSAGNDQLLPNDLFLTETSNDSNTDDVNPDFDPALLTLPDAFTQNPFNDTYQETRPSASLTRASARAADFQGIFVTSSIDELDRGYNFSGSMTVSEVAIGQEAGSVSLFENRYGMSCLFTMTYHATSQNGWLYYSTEKKEEVGQADCQPTGKFAVKPFDAGGGYIDAYVYSLEDEYGNAPGDIKGWVFKL